MKLQEFLEQNEGKWFAQRTNYYVEQDCFENGKTEITVELLSPDSSEITALCQNQVEQSQILGGIKSSWEHSSNLGKAQTNSVILVFANQHNEQEGQLFYQAGAASLVTGHYSLGQDNALTLSAKEKNTAFEERLWFASPNLRLRTSLFQKESGISTTAFYSEIRKLPPKAS